MKSDDRKFLKPENIFFKKNPNGNYLLANAEDNDFSLLELEDSGSEIWEKIMERKTFKEIYQWMAETYDAKPEDMKNDLDEFIEDLITKKYLI